MTPRENSFTFDLNPHVLPDPLTPGDLVLVRVLDLCSPVQELLWLQVTEVHPHGLYQGMALKAAEQFPEIPAGDLLYLKLEHVFVMCSAEAESGLRGDAEAGLSDQPAHRGWVDAE